MSESSRPRAPQARGPAAPTRPRPAAARRARRAERTERGERAERTERTERAAPADRPERPIPVVTYPEDLPVSARRQEIARAIAAHQVVIVSGETGSGKTTQLPKICLELGRGRRKMIGHPAAPPGRDLGGQAHRRGTEHADGRAGRLPGALQ